MRLASDINKNKKCRSSVLRSDIEINYAAAYTKEIS